MTGIHHATGLASYIPECPHGSILMTTRDRAVGVEFTRGRGKDLIEVDKMSEEESTELVKKKLDHEAGSRAEIDELTGLLKHLPLALAQAAAFMQENKITTGQYLDLYKSGDNQTKLLNEAFET